MQACQKVSLLCDCGYRATCDGAASTAVLHLWSTRRMCCTGLLLQLPASRLGAILGRSGCSRAQNLATLRPLLAKSKCGTHDTAAKTHYASRVTTQIYMHILLYGALDNAATHVCICGVPLNRWYTFNLTQSNTNCRMSHPLQFVEKPQGESELPYRVMSGLVLMSICGPPLNREEGSCT